MLKARNLEFFRDRAAFGWNFLFPIVIMLGFAFSFNDKDSSRYKVALINKAALEQSEVNIIDLKYIQFIEADDQELTVKKIEDHRLDMLLDGNEMIYYVNPESPNGYMLEKVLDTGDKTKLTKQEKSGESIRYIDWVVPGVLSMNLMFSALWGVGYVIVRYRKFGVLKRLKATPVKPVEFLTAQLLSRIWIIGITTFTLFFGLHLILDFKMAGSYWLLMLLFLLGGVSLICIGLVVAARIKNEELASGFLNVFSWPMMILSGIWFSLEGAHPWVQKLALFFPLTHLTSATRKVMLDGAGIIDVMPEISILVIISAVAIIVGSLLFKWE